MPASTNMSMLPPEQIMKLPRRDFLRLAAGAAVLPAISRGAWAQAYPVRPVRIVVPTPAGGGADIIARLLGQWLSQRLGQQFVIDNRPGAGTNIGTEAVAHAAPDGYSLLWITLANAVNASLYAKLNFDFIRDIAPVAGVVQAPFILALHPSVAAGSVPELIAYAKANPGKITMGSAGNGTPAHVAGELFMLLAGVKLLHVPYRGEAPALADLLGGQNQMLFASVPASLEHIRAGELRALAVTTARRLDVLPDVPTVAEFVPGYEANGWLGLGAPRGTPAATIERLNQAVTAGLADPMLTARFAELGDTALPLSSADFGRLIAEETDKWAKVVKFAGLKAE
jgi:tripartite-type tricarboxylate transporter receptor subunit TctC